MERAAPNDQENHGSDESWRSAQDFLTNLNLVSCLPGSQNFGLAPQVFSSVINAFPEKPRISILEGFPMFWAGDLKVPELQPKSIHIHVVQKY